MSQLPIIRAALLSAGVELPIAGLVNCQALIYRDRNTGDLLGYEEALADWLQAPKIRDGKMVRQGAGIILDDRQIVQWDGSRLLKDAADPRIEVTLTVVKEQPVSRELDL